MLLDMIIILFECELLLRHDVNTLGLYFNITISASMLSHMNEHTFAYCRLIDKRMCSSQHVSSKARVTMALYANLRACVSLYTYVLYTLYTIGSIQSPSCCTFTLPCTYCKQPDIDENCLKRVAPSTVIR